MTSRPCPNTLKEETVTATRINVMETII
jgi:hypothetical protein